MAENSFVAEVTFNYVFLPFSFLVNYVNRVRENSITLVKPNFLTIELISKQLHSQKQ